MKDWKIFIMSILILGTFSACKHEFEEGSTFSLKTKVELLSESFYYSLIHYYVDDEDIIQKEPWLSNCLCINITVFPNYAYSSIGGGVTARAKYISIKDSLDLYFQSCPNNLVIGLKKWKITYLKKGELHVRTNYQGKIHKAVLNTRYQKL